MYLYDCVLLQKVLRKITLTELTLLLHHYHLYHYIVFSTTAIYPLFVLKGLSIENFQIWFNFDFQRFYLIKSIEHLNHANIANNSTIRIKQISDSEKFNYGNKTNTWQWTIQPREYSKYLTAGKWLWLEISVEYCHGIK